MNFDKWSKYVETMDRSSSSFTLCNVWRITLFFKLSFIFIVIVYGPESISTVSTAYWIWMFSLLQRSTNFMHISAALWVNQYLDNDILRSDDSVQNRTCTCSSKQCKWELPQNILSNKKRGNYTCTEWTYHEIILFYSLNDNP